MNYTDQIIQYARKNDAYNVHQTVEVYKSSINFDKIFQTLDLIIDKNDTIYWLLGTMYKHGRGVKQNYEKAIEL